MTGFYHGDLESLHALFVPVLQRRLSLQDLQGARAAIAADLGPEIEVVEERADARAAPAGILYYERVARFEKSTGLSGANDNHLRWFGAGILIHQWHCLMLAGDLWLSTVRRRPCRSIFQKQDAPIQNPVGFDPVGKIGTKIAIISG